MAKIDDKRVFWYDTETSALNIEHGQVMSVAGLITRGFEIEKEFEIYIKPRIDCLPHPMAFAVHQLDIEQLEAVGVSEFEAAKIIQEQLIVPGRPTIICGYNNISFDDNQLRNTFFRTLSDVYSHEYKDGNSRLDIYKAVQLLYATRPELIDWPMKDDPSQPDRQVVSLKLEALANANGIEINAHDAMSDCRATLALAKLIHSKNDRFFDYLMTLSNKHHAKQMAICGKPVFQVDRLHGVDHRFTTLLLPLISDDTNANKILCADLRNDPTDMLAMSANELRDSLFTKSIDRPIASALRPPVSTITLNKLPILLPHEQFGTDEFYNQIQLDRANAERYQQQILADPTFRSRLRQAFMMPPSPVNDVYETIYRGFFSNSDRNLQGSLHLPNKQTGLPAIVQTSIIDYSFKCQDKYRNFALALRAKWNNYFEQVSSDPDVSPLEREQFVKHLHNCFFGDHQGDRLNLKGFHEAMNDTITNNDLTPKQMRALEKLSAYVSSREALFNTLSETVKNDPQLHAAKQAKSVQLHVLSRQHTNLVAPKNVKPTSSNTFQMSP